MKINTSHEAKLRSGIDAIQARARVRCIDPRDVAQAVAAIEKRLGSLMPKGAWKGLQFAIDPNRQNFPRAYDGAPMSTQFTLERGTKGWYVTGIERTYCRGAAQQIVSLNLREWAQDIMTHVTKPQNW